MSDSTQASAVIGSESAPRHEIEVEGLVPPYPIGAETARQIANAFSAHAPKLDQPMRYAKLRETARLLAVDIAQLAPPGRERALAMTKLEEAVMWASAAIARGE